MTRLLGLFLLLLLPVSALAQDPVLPLPSGTVLTFPDQTNGELSVDRLSFPLELPSLADGITKIPPGSYILIREEDGTFTPHTVAGKSWLMPDLHYTEALAKARELEVVSPALERCTERSLQWQDRVYSALEACSDQFGEDEALVAELTSDVREWETRALVAEEKVKRSRKAAAIAWSITGGILFGGIVATSVAVGL